MKFFISTILLMFTLTTAYAGFQGYSGVTDLKIFNKLKCSTGLTCTKVGDTFLMVSSPTITDVGGLAITGAEGVGSILTLKADESDDNGDDFTITATTANTLTFSNDSTGSVVPLTSMSTVGDWIFGGTTPSLTIGDAGAEDAGILFDGHSGGVDWNISSDDSVDKLVIGLGVAAGTTNRMAFNSADLNIVLGDASAADMSLVFDGNAQDFNIGLDDSTDDLVIGLGSAPGTTDAIRIDENQDVTFVQEVRGLGTDSMSGFLQKNVNITTVAITAVQCGSTFVGDSADVIVLPEASTVLGCRLTFAAGTADDVDINPADGTDVIGSITASGGTITPSAGDAIRMTDIGTSVTLQAVGANLWVAVSHNGPITDVN